MSKRPSYGTPEWRAQWLMRPNAARDAEIARLYAGGGETLKSLGERYSLSPERVRIIIFMQNKYGQKL